MDASYNNLMDALYNNNKQSLRRKHLSLVNGFQGGPPFVSVESFVSMESLVIFTKQANFTYTK